MKQRVSNYINGFLGLFYPGLCVSCGSTLYSQENEICTKCLVELPKTHYHKVKGNPIEQIFWGRVPIERATSFFFFKRASKFRGIIHQLKYKGRKAIGVEMGKQLGSALADEEAYNTIDFILPVPLHPKKKQKRGYNQSELIANGIAEFLPAKVNTELLIRSRFTQTQTQKSRFERWENVNEVFSVNNSSQLEGKHVLLVDDVLTTGATLEGCAQVLMEVPEIKISIATLAYALD